MDDQSQQQIENLVYQEAARFLDLLITPELECNMTEIAPLEVFAPTMHFPEIGLRITRLWAVALGKQSCFVVEAHPGRPGRLPRPRLNWQEVCQSDVAIM